MQKFDISSILNPNNFTLNIILSFIFMILFSEFISSVKCKHIITFFLFCILFFLFCPNTGTIIEFGVIIPSPI